MILGSLTVLSGADIQTRDLVVVEPKSLVNVVDCILRSVLEPPIAIAPDAKLSMHRCILYGTWATWFRDHHDQLSAHGGNVTVAGPAWSGP